MKRNEPRSGKMGVKGTRSLSETMIVPDFKGKISEIKRADNGKYYVEFDEIPALLFISHDGNGAFDQLVLVRGKWLKERDYEENSLFR